MKIFNTLTSLLKRVWTAEPLMVVSAVVSAVIAVASFGHIVLQPHDVAAVVLPVLTALLGRPHVTPKAK